MERFSGKIKNHFGFDAVTYNALGLIAKKI